MHRISTSRRSDWNELSVLHRPSGPGPRSSKSFSISVSICSPFNTLFITLVHVRNFRLIAHVFKMNILTFASLFYLYNNSTSDGVRLFLLPNGVQFDSDPVFSSHSYWLKSFNAKPKPVPGKSYTVGQINLR